MSTEDGYQIIEPAKRSTKYKVQGKGGKEERGVVESSLAFALGSVFRQYRPSNYGFPCSLGVENAQTPVSRIVFFRSHEDNNASIAVRNGSEQTRGVG